MQGSTYFDFHFVKVGYLGVYNIIWFQQNCIVVNFRNYIYTFYVIVIIFCLQNNGCNLTLVFFSTTTSYHPRFQLLIFHLGCTYASLFKVCVFVNQSMHSLCLLLLCEFYNFTFWLHSCSIVHMIKVLFLSVCGHMVVIMVLPVYWNKLFLLMYVGIIFLKHSYLCV